MSSVEFSCIVVEGDKRKEKKIFGIETPPYYCVHQMNIRVEKSCPP